MDDVLIEVIYFDQNLVLDKKDFEVLHKDEVGVVLLYKDDIHCRPYLYFRPTNVGDSISEHDAIETIWECYEGQVNIVSQLIEESSEKIHIKTCYAMLKQGNNDCLTGVLLTYHQDDDTAFEYQIENSLAPEDEFCTPLNPLGLSVEGTLQCKIKEEPLVGSFFMSN